MFPCCAWMARPQRHAHQHERTLVTYERLSSPISSPSFVNQVAMGVAAPPLGVHIVCICTLCLEVCLCLFLFASLPLPRISAHCRFPSPVLRFHMSRSVLDSVSGHLTFLLISSMLACHVS